jgi:hypothetical protein
MFVEVTNAQAKNYHQHRQKYDMIASNDPLPVPPVNPKYLSKKSMH